MPTTATEDLTGVVQMHEVTQDSINLSLMSDATEGSVFPLVTRQIWEIISINNRKPLPIEKVTFSYLSLTGLIIGRASSLVGTEGGGT
jgi:hypothetical protein